MTVTIIDPIPDPEVVKKVICRNCGVRLSYVPHDVKEGKSYDYTGSCDIYYYIPCPNCSNEQTVRRY